MFNRQFTRVLIAGLFSVGISGTVMAQDANPDKQQRADERKAQRQGEREQGNDKAQTDQWPATWHKASQIIGLRVDDKDGKKIGDIRNLAINAENGRIRYAIVEIPNGLTVVPMPVLRVSKNRDRATVDTTAEHMKNAPPFQPEGWNTIGDTRWAQDVYSFYGIEKAPDFDRERPDFVQAGQVIGGKVEARKGESLGTIKDIVVDADKGAVVYNVVTSANENKLFAAPWQSFIISDLGKKIVLRGVERDDLAKASGFANNRWPGEKDFSWNKDSNFDSRPPTWLYGFKGNGSGGGAGGGGADDDSVMGGWQTNSKYGQMFDRKTIERVRGTIVRSESVKPLPGMDAGTALVVKADGKNVVVHLGPEWFVRHQQGEFREGAEVDVSGSRVTIEGAPAIMATQLRINGRTMTLREDSGIPAWDAWQERKRD